MKLSDLTILIYAVDEDSPHHRQARPWLEETLSGTETVAMAWSVLVGFIRLSTRSAAFLAALAIEYGAELCFTDSDFSRFPGVRWSHPLA